MKSPTDGVVGSLPYRAGSLVSPSIPQPLTTVSNNGDAEIMIYFKQVTDAGMSAVNVQNRVATAQSLLPAEVVKIGVTTDKQQNAELKTFSLYDPEARYGRRFLDYYLKMNGTRQLCRPFQKSISNGIQCGPQPLQIRRALLHPPEMAHMGAYW